MFLKKVTCGVCGYRFTPQKDEIYTAQTPRSFLSSLTSPPEYFDAMDCPHCGCQTMLKIRADRVEKKETEPVEIEEEKELECQETEL